MSQVSSRPVNKKTQDRIWMLFVACINVSGSKNLAEGFITDLLTPTERVMLSKRFAIAYMLLQGYPYDDISSVLKVSSTTVGSVSRWMKTEGDSLREIILEIKRQEKWESLINEINLNLKQLLNPKPLTKRKYMRHIIDQERIDMERAF